MLGAEVTGLKSWIEGEDNFSDILIFPFELTSHATVDTLILAEGQAGITFGADNRALAYVDAGFAMADISLDSHLKIPGLFSEKIFDASNTANGVVVGGGIDYALAGYPNVVLGLSFKHIVLNELDLSDTLKGGMSYGAEPVCECRGDAWKIDTNSNFNIDQVMGRIAVHF